MNRYPLEMISVKLLVLKVRVVTDHDPGYLLYGGSARNMYELQI